MKRIFAFLLAVILGGCGLNAQPAATQTRTPKQLVEAYWRVETAGERLTPEGWNRANVFFVRPTPLPKDIIIVVIRANSGVWEPFLNGRTAKVGVGLNGLIIGEVDSTMRFRRHSTDAIKEGALFNLVLTDRHWKRGSDGITWQEETGPFEWKMEDTGAKIWLNREAVIRYVTHIRDVTTSPVVKKNANETLMALRSQR